MAQKIIKDLDDPRMYRPFVAKVKMALDYANKYRFSGRLKIAETYRTIERQSELYENAKIHAAKPGFSYHNHGMAVDVFVLDHYNRYSNNHADYKIVTEIFSRFGLRYLRNSDLVHFQWGTTLRIEDVINTYMALDHDDLTKQIHCLLDYENCSFEKHEREYGRKT